MKISSKAVEEIIRKGGMFVAKKNYTRETFKSREDWLNARGLGGSSASVILGDSPYETRLELLQKIILPKEEQSEDKTNEEAKQHGNIAEPALRVLFKANHPEYKVLPPKAFEMYRRKDKPYLTATLDGQLYNALKEKGFIECKTRQVRRRSDLEEWFDGNGKPTILPQRYFDQVIHYFNVLNDMKFCWLVVEFQFYTFDGEEEKYDHSEIYFYYIERNKVEDSIKALDYYETDFWENDVMGKRIPKIMVELPKLN